MKTWIIVRADFLGLHRWEDAPDSEAFLRHAHRHLFKVEAKIGVHHDDRELEFFAVQRRIRDWCQRRPYDLGQQSCEQLAAAILDDLQSAYGAWRSIEVTVSEDGENAAVVAAEVEP